jgi:hypothetical protein
MAAKPFKPSVVYKQEGFEDEAHSFDVEGFNDAIRSQGVPLVHYRAMVCPIGIHDKDDALRRVHVDHPGCSGGYLYKKIGTITALMVGQSTDPSYEDPGMLDGSTVSASFPRAYEDSDADVYVVKFDRFYLADEKILWPQWELIEHNAVDLRDRLHFPARKVEHLIDNQGNEYKECEDFDVDAEGQIKWRLDGKSPGSDLDTSVKRGRVYAVWYLYQPYWYCKRLVHDLRVVQGEDDDGVRKTIRMPFQATLVRENVFENEQVQDADAENGERTQRQPADGSVPAH